MVLREELVKNGSWPAVLERAARLADLSTTTNPVAWFKMNIPCPVLDPGTKDCLAYKVRPAACSSHFVISDPSSCDPWSLEELAYEPADSAAGAETFRRGVAASLGPVGVLSTTSPMAASLVAADRLRETGEMSPDEIVSLIGRETR